MKKKKAKKRRVASTRSIDVLAVTVAVGTMLTGIGTVAMAVKMNSSGTNYELNIKNDSHNDIYLITVPPTVATPSNNDKKVESNADDKQKTESI